MAKAGLLSKSPCFSNPPPLPPGGPAPSFLSRGLPEHWPAGISQEATKDAGDNSGAVSLGPGTGASRGPLAWSSALWMEWWLVYLCWGTRHGGPGLGRLQSRGAGQRRGGCCPQGRHMGHQRPSRGWGRRACAGRALFCWLRAWPTRQESRTGRWGLWPPLGEARRVQAVGHTVTV